MSESRVKSFDLHPGLLDLKIFRKGLIRLRIESNPLRLDQVAGV